MTQSSVLFVACANFAGLFFIAFFCVCVIMATNFLELATSSKYLGAKWLLEKKVNFTPCNLFVSPKEKHKKIISDVAYSNALLC